MVEARCTGLTGRLPQRLRLAIVRVARLGGEIVLLLGFALLVLPIAIVRRLVRRGERPAWRAVGSAQDVRRFHRAG